MAFHFENTTSRPFLRLSFIAGLLSILAGTAACSKGGFSVASSGASSQAGSSAQTSESDLGSTTQTPAPGSSGTPVKTPTSGAEPETPPALVASISATDPRIRFRLDPSMSFAENGRRNGFLVHTFDNWSFSGGGVGYQFPAPNLGAFTNESFSNNGVVTLARRNDSANGSYFYHHINSQTEASRYPGTYRSEILAAEDPQTSMLYGRTYWIAYGVKLGADTLASYVSLFDLHAPYGTVNIGPGVVGVWADNGGIRVVRSSNPNPAASQTGCAPTSYPVRPCDQSPVVSTDASTWNYIIMRISLSWSSSNEGMKVWIAKNSGAPQLIWNAPGGIGYNEPSLPQFVYPKLGLYNWSAPSPSRTTMTKGMYIIQDGDGATPLNEQTMLKFIRSR